MAGRFGGIQKLKTAQTQKIRSAPCDSKAGPYLEMYMLLKQKERMERRGGRDQLEALLKRISEMESSLGPRREETEPATDRQAGEESSRKDWRVMSVDY